MLAQRTLKCTMAYQCQKLHRGTNLDRSDSLSISAPYLVNLCASLQKKMKVGLIKSQCLGLNGVWNGRTIHCGDRVSRSNVTSSIYVTFEEVDVRVFFGEGFEGGRNHMTWTTPGIHERQKDLAIRNRQTMSHESQ